MSPTSTPVPTTRELRAALASLALREGHHCVYIMREYYPLTSDYRFEHPISIPHHGLEFHTVEHYFKYYQYNSPRFSLESHEFQQACLSDISAPKLRGLERRLGKYLTPLPDWAHQRYAYMYTGHLHKHLNNPGLKDILLSTDTRPLIAPCFRYDASGYPWADIFWETLYDDDLTLVGGANVLGHLLEHLRTQLRDFPR